MAWCRQKCVVFVGNGAVESVGKCGGGEIVRGVGILGGDAGLGKRGM